MSAIFSNIGIPFSLAVEYVSQAEFEAAGLKEWLSEDEQARYDELKIQAVAKRSRQWLLGRYAAKVACRRWLKEQGFSAADWRDIQISNDPNGMPHLAIKGLTASPTLSIAHSGDEAIAAIAPHGYPIGVDIEQCILSKNLAALAKRVCYASEYQRWFADMTEDLLSERFRQIWLAKEAVAKCNGRGLQWRTGAYEVIDIQRMAAYVIYGDERYVVCLAEGAGDTACAVAFLSK